MSPRVDRLAQFFRLARPEQGIVLLAALSMPAVALGLRLIGLRRVRSLLAFGTPDPHVASSRPADSRLASSTARLVAAAARYGPYKASCLPMSLTLAWLLRRQGIATELRFGVRKVADRLEAHAWIEHQGRPLIDPPDVHDRFAAFAPVVIPGTTTSP